MSGFNNEIVSIFGYGKLLEGVNGNELELSGCKERFELLSPSNLFFSRTRTFSGETFEEPIVILYVRTAVGATNYLFFTIPDIPELQGNLINTVRFSARTRIPLYESSDQ